MLRGPGSCLQKLCKRKQFCEQFKFKKLVSSNPWSAVAAITNNFTSFRAQKMWQRCDTGGDGAKQLRASCEGCESFTGRRDVVNPRRGQSSPPHAQGQGVISTTKRRIFYCQCRCVVISISYTEICEQNTYHSHQRWPRLDDGAGFTLSFGSHYHITRVTCLIHDCVTRVTFFISHNASINQSQCLSDLTSWVEL